MALIATLGLVASAASAPIPVTYEPERVGTMSLDAKPAAPSFPRGPAARPRAAEGGTDQTTPPLLTYRPRNSDPAPVLLDNYIQDGFETALTVNPWDPQNAVTVFEEGWDFDPDIPLSWIGAGKQTWVSAEFPPGEGIYGGYPFSPWAAAGNTPGEFFTSLIRRDLYPTDNTHTIVARAPDAGAGFSKFYEVDRAAFQDRSMFDIDRTASRGGVEGAHDGKIYLCFDDWGLGGLGYTGSFLQVLSPAGVLLDEVVLSGTGSPPFRGTQFQPVAGTTDGQIFLVSNSISNGGATVYATFHELADGGNGTQVFSKGTLSWAPAGQRLGGSTRWGLNGHRIDERGFLDMDRTNGPHHGYLYFVTNRNPNPGDPSQDQGDIYLSISYTRGSTWQSAKLPLQLGHSQFFPMLDVDEQGWVHVAYYQNELGYVDHGYLNASLVNVYYTVSRDGGKTWAPPVRVNEIGNGLNMEDPPLELSTFEYNLLGDYMQVQAAGQGNETAAYVAWTGYDQYRSDDGVGTKKQRVYATLVAAPPAPAGNEVVVVALGGLMALVGALGVARRRARRSA